jgi:HlyD family secretion protein
MKKRVFIIIGVILVLAVVGVIALPRIFSSMKPGQAQSQYQTEAARLGNITVYVGATGSVRSNQTASIPWETSGKVGKVNVAKGQVVKADTVLGELDPGSVSQNLIQAQADLINAKDALDKLMNNSEARSNAHLALIQAQQALDDAEKESRSKLYQRASKETIDIARANLITANESLDSAENTFNQFSGLGEDSPVYAAALSQYARARQEQQRAEYNLRYVQDLPDPLSVEEVYAKLEQAKSKLLAAKTEWERIKDGPDPKDIATAQVRVDVAQATLDTVRLKAPFSGTVTNVKAQVGDLVNAGQFAVQIDDLTRLLIDIQVSEVDINRVQIGQPVTLNFDAIPGTDYTGTVNDISASGTSVNGAVNFTVTVEVDGADENIKAGMTAAANIAISQLENVLLVPSRAVKTINNQRVVYVLRNNFPTAIDITLGASANNYSQILSGDIKEGDMIILNPPATLNMGGPMGGGARQQSSGGN